MARILLLIALTLHSSVGATNWHAKALRTLQEEEETASGKAKSACDMLTDMKAGRLCKVYDAKDCGNKDTPSCAKVAQKYLKIVKDPLPQLGGCPCFTRQDLQNAFDAAGGGGHRWFCSTTYTDIFSGDPSCCPTSGPCFDQETVFRATVRSEDTTTFGLDFDFRVKTYRLGGQTALASCHFSSKDPAVVTSRENASISTEDSIYDFAAFEACRSMATSFCETTCPGGIDYSSGDDGVCYFGDAFSCR